MSKRHHSLPDLIFEQVDYKPSKGITAKIHHAVGRKIIKSNSGKQLIFLGIGAVATAFVIGYSLKN